MNGARRTGTRRPLRLLHTSDVHLGAYDSFGSAERRESLEDGFRRVIDAGLRAQVDLVLIAGDFFDNARVREETLRFAAFEIARAEVPVVIAPGNHDHVGPGSVYDRLDLTALAPNLRLMRVPDGESIAIEPLDVEVWGRSHTELDPRFTPFEGAPGPGEAAWQLGIGHGHYIHPRAALHHSFHIRREHLETLGRDYVALGHWERMTRVEAGESVIAAYSGAPESLGGREDLGRRVLIVDLEASGRVHLTAESLDGEAAIPHEKLPYLRGA